MTNQDFLSSLREAGVAGQQHGWGAFGDDTLQALRNVLPRHVRASLETGCGKSTVMLSNMSASHHVFAYDDRDRGDHSSVLFFQTHPMLNPDTVTFVPGPTQQTLPRHTHDQAYDIILLDGPHGAPFVELEYYHTYPHLRPGGFLILDDTHITSIGRLADILKEDAMFEYHALVENTLVLRRTDAPVFDPLGDGWNLQDYNRRRLDAHDPKLAPHRLEDGGRLKPMAEIIRGNLPFEQIAEADPAPEAGPPRPGRAAGQGHRREAGVAIIIAGRRITFSAANAVRKMRRLTRRVGRLFS